LVIRLVTCRLLMSERMLRISGSENGASPRYVSLS